MLDQLVESKADVQSSKWRTGLLIVTFTLIVSGFVSGLGYSLFNENLFVGVHVAAPPTPVSAVPRHAVSEPGECLEYRDHERATVQSGLRLPPGVEKLLHGPGRRHVILDLE